MHGLYWLMVNLAATGPVLAVFDDAHWGDQASLVASGYLARRVYDHPIALITGVRSDEPGSKARSLMPIFLEADAMIIRPGPLTEGGAGEIVGSAFDRAEVSPELAAAAAEATGGNPFFLTELARELASSHGDPGELAVEQIHEAGPATVSRSLLMRLGALGSECRQMAQALAVLGGEGELRHAAAIAGLDNEAGTAATDKLVEVGLVEGVVPLKLKHPLVRAAIADDIPATAQAVAHRRALEVLRAEGDTDDALSVHALGAEPVGDAETVALLRRTADRARLGGTPQTAVSHLRRALAEPPDPEVRPSVLADLGRAEVRAGAFEDGIEHLTAALDGLGDPGRRIDVHRDRVFAAFASGGIDGARELVLNALAEVERSDSDGAMQLEADLAVVAWISGTDPGIDIRRHLGVEGRTSAERMMLALLAQTELVDGEPADHVIDLAGRALGGGRLIAEDTSESLAWYLATFSLVGCEAFDMVAATTAQAVADGHRRGSLFGRTGALSTRSVLAIYEGRPRDAEVDAATALAGGSPPIVSLLTASHLVRALAAQGKLDEAEEALVANGIDQGPEGATMGRLILWGRAVLREAQGDLAALRTEFAPLEEDERNGGVIKTVFWRAMLARMISRGGYSEEADRLATGHLEWAEWWGRPGALGIARRSAALAGPPELRIERLREAVETLASSALKVEEAKARVDLGTALLREGRKNDGKAELEAGLEIALERGARPIAEAAAGELEIAGAAPKRLSFDELTASERRIAEYAADGKTNREIAAELFVTPKTVENHLTRVYAKLGIGSRRELGAALDV